MKVLYTAPHIPSTNLDLTADFLVRVFSFEIRLKNEAYVELGMDNLVIGLLAADSEPNQQSFAIEVEGIEELWSTQKDYLNQFHTRALFTQDYGAKEFHVVMPETNTLLFVSERQAE